ncbi:MAG: class I SAM-dependent methyltransferase [Candidatus Cloacimonetes bacterium]|nr:class I SAM-dependent methyltransferase [Candidatus Cloacimonadota bacterium]
MNIDIVDYDKSGYDYIRFWQSRQYENQSERLALVKLLPKAGNLLVDLGGGFGRLSDCYCSRFSHCVLLDYSQKNLDQARILTETKKIANLTTKRGNIYDLPFKNGEFDCALMIRVIHHLLQPEKAIKEAARILKPEGILILEFANKIHLKARLRAWLRGDWGFSKNLNPSKAQTGILINYHPKYIIQILEATGFTVEKKISASHFRIPILKKIIPMRILLFGESLLQSFPQLSLARFYFGPSVFLYCRKKTNL